MFAFTSARFTYAAKFAAAIGLAIFADYLFTWQRAGATIGLYLGLLLIAAMATRPATLRQPAGLAAVTFAALMVGALIDDPSLLALALFWAGIGVAMLVPRARADDAWRWALRLVMSSVLLVTGPFRDLRLWSRAKRRRGGASFGARAPRIALPVIGSAVFLGLFAAANPLIGDALARLDGWVFARVLSPLSLLVIALAFFQAWAVFRPARHALAPGVEWARVDLPGVTLGSVTLSLAAFNALFALQNALDIAFLWSGAALPAGVSLADYAHRGAYPLIATALLAGLFVIVALRPGSATAASPLVQRLVTLWIAQNIVLVASSILRTLDYIDAYSLTRLRIAALSWMVLVAIGLMLICWRLLRGKSAAWLINANAGAALLALTACCFVDLGAVAARWNVVHAAEAGGRGAALDVCYLNGLGASALVPVTELEARLPQGELRERLGWLRNQRLDWLEADQADWHGWTWRGARRLAETRELIGANALPRSAAEPRECDGRPFAPEPTPGAPIVTPQPTAPPPTPPPAPLTGAPRR